MQLYREKEMKKIIFVNKTSIKSCEKIMIDFREAFFVLFAKKRSRAMQTSKKTDNSAKKMQNFCKNARYL